MGSRKKLAISSFLAQFTIAMVNFSLVYFMRDKHGLSSAAIGIASSLYTLFYFLFCLVYGRFLSNVGNKGKVVASLIGMAMAIAFVLLSPNSISLYIALSLYGVAMALLWPNIEEWITQSLEGEELSKAVSSFNFSWSFGAGISTAFGGFFSQLGVSFPLVIAIALFFATAIWVLFIKDDGDAERNEECDSDDHSTPWRYLCWCGLVCVYVGYSLIITIFPLYASSKLMFSETLTGNLLLFRGVSACISFVILGRELFWQFKASVVFLSQIAFAMLAFLLSYLKSPVVLAIYFVVFGFIFALSYELSIFHGAAGARNRAQRMMTHEVLLTVGTVIGSSLGGIIYQYISFNAVLYSISASTAVLVIVEIFLYKLRLEPRALDKTNQEHNSSHTQLNCH